MYLSLDIGLKWVGYVRASIEHPKFVRVIDSGVVKREKLITFLSEIPQTTSIVIGVNSDLDGNKTTDCSLSVDEDAVIKDFNIFYQDEFNSSQEASDRVGSSKLAIQSMSAQIILERFVDERQWK